MKASMKYFVLQSRCACQSKIVVLRITLCYSGSVYLRYRAASRSQGAAPEAEMSFVPNLGNGKITVPDLLRRKSQAAGFHSKPEKITRLTAYDYPTARLLDEA